MRNKKPKQLQLYQSEIEQLFSGCKTPNNVKKRDRTNVDHPKNV